MRRFSGVIAIKSITDAWILVQIFGYFTNRSIAKAKALENLLRCANMGFDEVDADVTVDQIYMSERSIGNARDIDEEIEQWSGGVDVAKQDRIVSALEILKHKALEHGGTQTTKAYTRHVVAFVEDAGDDEDGTAIATLGQQPGGFEEVKKQLQVTKL